VPASPPQATAALTVTAASNQAALPSPPVKTPRLTIRADQSSWVMISDNHGDALFDKVLKPGEGYTLPDKPGMTLTTGNGAGIILTLNGVELPKLSSRSSGIIRNIPLDSSSLKNLMPRD
jgi:cytoskeleton protein RodZ